MDEIFDLDLGNGAVIDHVQLALSGSISQEGTLGLASGAQLKNLTHATLRFRRVDFFVAESALMAGALASYPVGIAVGTSTALAYGWLGIPVIGLLTGAVSETAGIRLNHLTIDGIVDAEGQTLCQSGANDFRDNWGNKAQVHSLAELVGRCKKHKFVR